jgi:hypothetical protein
MMGEAHIGGVLVPRLLLLAVAALAPAALTQRLLTFAGARRLFAYPPLVDLSLYVIWLGLLEAFARLGEHL